MLQMVQSWLTVLTGLYWVIGIGSTVGIALWFFVARRRPTPALSAGQRVTLSFFLAGLLFAWCQAQRVAPDLQNKIARKRSMILTQTTGDRLNITPPVSASFADPQLRTVDNHEVLLLQTPARMEWTLDGDAASVTIAYGFDPPSYERGTTNGAEVIVEFSDGKTTRQIYHRALDPIRRPADRGRQQDVIKLPPNNAGARLSLQTTPGEYGDTSWDWVYLAEFRFRKSVWKP